MTNFTPEQHASISKLVRDLGNDLSTILNIYLETMPRFVTPEIASILLSEGISRFLGDFIFHRVDEDPLKTTKDFCTSLTQTVEELLMRHKEAIQ